MESPTLSKGGFFPTVQNLTLISAVDHAEGFITDCPDGVKSIRCFSSSISSGSGISSTATPATSSVSASGWSFQTKLHVLYSKYPVDKWKANGFYDDSLVHSIDQHWLKFDPASTQLHISLAIIYTAIMCVGLFGNLLVIIMFSRCRSLRTPANYLILNLAVADGLLLSKIPIFIFNSINEGPALGYFGCQFYGFVGGLMGTASIMTLMFVAIDRYYVIVFPLNPFKKTTHRRAIFMIVIVWIYSIIFASIPFFLLDGYVPEGILTSCSFDYLDEGVRARIFVFVYFVAAWVLPISLIIFSYVSIFRMVVQAEQRFDEDVGRKSRKDNDKLRKELKIAMVTTVIVLLWLFAWTPYAIVALLGIFNQRHVITPLVSSIPAVFCKVASAIDPFIYSISHPRFKRELLKTPLKTLCICLIGGRGRRYASKDTSSHYYSATCIDKSTEDERSHGNESHERERSSPLINSSSQVTRLTIRSRSYSCSMTSPALTQVSASTSTSNQNRNLNFSQFEYPTDNRRLSLNSPVEEKEEKELVLEMSDLSQVSQATYESDVPISMSTNVCVSEIDTKGGVMEKSVCDMIEMHPNQISNRKSKESPDTGVPMKRVRISCNEKIEHEAIGAGTGTGAGTGVYSPIISPRPKIEIPKTSLRNPKSINTKTSPSTPTHTNYRLCKSPKVGKNETREKAEPLLEQEQEYEKEAQPRRVERKRQEISTIPQTSIKVGPSESSNSREMRGFTGDLDVRKTRNTSSTTTKTMPMPKPMMIKISSTPNATIETELVKSSSSPSTHHAKDDEETTELNIKQSAVTVYKSTRV